jgi:hypothetical protein
MQTLFGDISNIISLSITPAFLLLGVLMQVRVLNNRLLRIADRRSLLEERLMRGLGLSNALAHELSIMSQRTHALHRAAACAMGCMVMVCMVVVVLFADDAFALKLGSLIAFLFVAAMLLLIASFSLFLHEIFIASHALPSAALHRPQEPQGRP